MGTLVAPLLPNRSCCLSALAPAPSPRADLGNEEVTDSREGIILKHAGAYGVDIVWGPLPHHRLTAHFHRFLAPTSLPQPSDEDPAALPPRRQARRTGLFRHGARTPAGTE